MFFKTDIIEANQNNNRNKLTFIAIIVVVIVVLVVMVFVNSAQFNRSQTDNSNYENNGVKEESNSIKENKKSSLQYKYQQKDNEEDSSSNKSNEENSKEENTRIALNKINEVVLTMIQIQTDVVTNDNSQDSESFKESENAIGIPDVEAKINKMFEKIKTYVDWSLTPSEKNAFDKPLNLMFQRLREGQPQTSFIGIMTNGEMYEIYLNDMYGAILSNIPTEQLEIVTPYPEDAKSNLLYNLVLKEIHTKQDIKIDSIEIDNSKVFKLGDQEINSFVKCNTNYGSIYLDIDLNVLDVLEE